MTVSPLLRRSALTVPLSSERFLAKAHLRGADAITLDLEDGVAPSEKHSARQRLPEAVAAVGRAGADVGVRINRPLRLAVRDIEAAVISGVSYLAISKADSADHIRLIADMVKELESERGLPYETVRLTAAIETPAALSQAHAIASADPRLCCLGLGSEDMAAACGMEPTPEALFVPKQLVVFAARAAGILPTGFVGSVADYSNLDELRSIVRRSKALGFRGGNAIHPAQIPILNAEFAPTPAEVSRARVIIEASERAEQEGRGAFALDGRMVDRPVVVRAIETMALAGAIAVKEERMKPFLSK